MQLGTAKLAITPPMPVRLCGYATRKTPFERVNEDIFLRVHLHRSREGTILFVYADLLWWSGGFVDAAREMLSARYAIPIENIFFVASHNHSGPPTGGRFTPSLEEFSPGYADFLMQRVEQVVRIAQENLEPVNVFRHDGTCALNVYRRVISDSGVLMRPNYQVPADHTLTIFAFRRLDGSLKGCMVHYPCHANLSDQNAVSPDYPGVALRMLDGDFPDSVSLFLQGCTADLRPNSVLGDRFVTVDHEKVLLFAENFHRQCKALLEQPGKAVQPCLRTSRTTASLPLEGVLSKEELRARLKTAQGVEREWARAVWDSGSRAFEELEVSCIRYGPEMCFYTFNAEVAQEYAAFARGVRPGAVCIAYTNGMIGYLCTAGQIAHGGYEPKESALYFALAGTYSQEIEPLIKKAIRSVDINSF